MTKGKRKLVFLFILVNSPALNYPLVFIFKCFKFCLPTVH